MIRAAIVLCVLTGPAAAQLTEGRAITTGTDQRTRADGLRTALTEVLVKSAADPAIADDPRVAALNPAAMLESLAYFDRMSDQPRHDEQGTRDRPHTLVARFRPEAVAAALAALGRAPYAGVRTLLVGAAITTRDGSAFPLTGDGAPDERHRAALAEAARRCGADVRLPLLDGPAPAPEGAAALRGTLRWSDADFGWVAEWRLGSARWTVAGVNFDAAYREGVCGALARLASPPPLQDGSRGKTGLP